MVTKWRCVFEVVLSQVKKTDEQNFPYFDLFRLINNKISELYQSIYKERLEKD